MTDSEKNLKKSSIECKKVAQSMFIPKIYQHCKRWNASILISKWQKFDNFACVQDYRGHTFGLKQLVFEIRQKAIQI